MNNKSKNILSLDDSDGWSLRLGLLKVIFSIAVIYMHSYAPQYEFFSAAVSQFPVVHRIVQLFISCMGVFIIPVFFCMSGYIYFLKRYESSWFKFAWQKFRGIMLPYFIWNTLAIIGIFIVQIPKFTHKLFPSGKIIADFDIWQWIGAYIGWGEHWFPFLYPLWFLPYLFVVFAIVHACRKVFFRWDWPIWILLGVHLIVLSYMPVVWQFKNYTALLLLIYTLTFFLLGKLLMKYRTLLDSSRVLWGSGIVLCAVMPLEIYHVAPNVQWSVIVSYAGVIFIFSLSRKVVKFKEKIGKTIMFLAGYSFFIYLMHGFLISGLQAVIYPLLPRQPLVVLAAFLLLPLLLAAVLIAAGYILKRLLPNVYSFLLGGRLKSNRV